MIPYIQWYSETLHSWCCTCTDCRNATQNIRGQIFDAWANLNCASFSGGQKWATRPRIPRTISSRPLARDYLHNYVKRYPISYDYGVCTPWILKNIPYTACTSAVLKTALPARLNVSYWRIIPENLLKKIAWASRSAFWSYRPTVVGMIPDYLASTPRILQRAGFSVAVIPPSFIIMHFRLIKEANLITSRYHWSRTIEPISPTS